ncbi:MAG TPA: type II secretion system secretin GspD [Gammaproteobacteria bacterium]|nr:type II secretion system secretin GspD [Gammaproteobacteria bacterium]
MLICFALLFAMHAAHADNGITLNFKDADIREVAATIGQITHKNFIIDPRVQGRVTVISSKPINADTVYAAFLSVLEVHGLAAVPAGTMTKIVPALEARQMPGSAFGNGTPGDAVVTQVVQINNVSSAQLVPVLRPLMSAEAQLAAYPPSNMLIISDRAGNLTRLLGIIQRLDQPTSSEVEVIPLQNASAGDVAQVITSLMQTQQGAEAGPPLKLVADSRTNSILLSGDTSDRLRIRALIARLDMSTETGNTQVVYLHYAKAKDIADELKTFVTDLQKQSGGGTAASGNAGQPNVSLIPDERTNSLVITAPPKIMRSVQDVIIKLDIRRAQVLVQAIEAELTSDKSAQLGVTWVADALNSGAAGLTDFSNTGPGVGGLIQQALTTTNGVPSSTGSTGITLPQGLTLGVGKFVKGGFSFAALLSALAGDADTNILSTPSIVTLDNQEADIKVAQQVPFVTGQYTNTTGGSTTGGAVINPFQTVQRQDVGLELKITPQINEGNSILLKIDQIISNLTGNSVGGQPVTNTREIKTSVMAQSGEIIVLGGLLDHQLIENEQHVPLLGSIPLLGNLFKYRSTTYTKSNLMLFIQPTILRSPEAADNYTSEGYKYLRNLQLQNQSPVQLMPDEKRPILKPFNNLSPPASAPATVPATTTTHTTAQAAASQTTLTPAAAVHTTSTPTATTRIAAPAAASHTTPTPAAAIHTTPAPVAATTKKPAAVPPSGVQD